MLNFRNILKWWNGIFFKQDIPNGKKQDFLVFLPSAASIHHKLVVAHINLMRNFQYDQASNMLDLEPSARCDEKQAKIYTVTYRGDEAARDNCLLLEKLELAFSWAKTGDHILLDLESGGGYASHYGNLAHSLLKFRSNPNITFHIFIGTIAASGGYMLACTANKIACSPWAIIGSIGVVQSTLNYFKLFRKLGIELELLTAGDHKVGLTEYGENTDATRLREQMWLDYLHGRFKEYVRVNREGKVKDIHDVATGRVWMGGEEAVDKGLVDVVCSRENYLSSIEEEIGKTLDVIEISHTLKDTTWKLDDFKYKASLEVL